MAIFLDDRSKFIKDSSTVSTRSTGTIQYIEMCRLDSDMCTVALQIIVAFYINTIIT